MSAGYQAVQWNRAKLIYDAVLLLAVGVFVVAHVAVSARFHPPNNALDWIDLRINAFGACAFTMLTVILGIGPLARLDRRFLVLLYNRRHLGVLTFLVGLMHAIFMLEWFWAQGSFADLVAEMTNWSDYGRFIGFPFKALGIGALAIMLLLAVTSHDYWLAFLGPRVWKALHMALYGAYGLAIMHVALGVMQDDRRPLIPLLLAAALAWVTALHVLAAWRERTVDAAATKPTDGWLVVGAPDTIPDKGARIVQADGGERIAVFRDGRQIGALSNLCAHQHGPLGEGCIIDGLVTCPWHGYQYQLADGRAPAPFTERLATYRVRLREGIIEVDPRALPPGTPAAIEIGA